MDQPTLSFKKIFTKKQNCQTLNVFLESFYQKTIWFNPKIKKIFMKRNCGLINTVFLKKFVQKIRYFNPYSVLRKF